jgi:hypothetical protein
VKSVAKKKTKKKVAAVDWSDEDSVKAAMASELEVDVNDLEIEEDRGLSGFREGTFYLITVGRQEYQVAESEDAAYNLAVAVVLQDIESEPDLFEPNFVESHINVDRVRRDLHSDVQSGNYDRLHEEAERRPMEFLKDNNIDIPEPTTKQLKDHAEAMSDEENSAASILAKLEEGDAEDKWIEMGEEPEVPDREVERIAEEQTDEELKDPVQYLKDMFGEEDGIKKAIEIGGIDEKAAAGEAVDTDGAGHFLARYDGNMHDGPGGIVWWRSN